MAFQDFDVITEKRKNDRKQKLKKRILIAAISTIVLAGAAVGAVFVVVSKSGDGKSDKEASPSSSSTSPATNQISHSQKMVETVCNFTDYKKKCEDTLGKEVQKDPKLAEFKDLLRISMEAAADEVVKGFNRSSNLQFENDDERDAFKDCKQLYDDAKEELEWSLSQVKVDDLKKLSLRTDDMNCWLSAVIAYQKTCLLAFPEGKTEKELHNVFRDSMQYVSNSLAIMSEVGSFLSSFSQKPTQTHRRLLSTEEFDSDWVPSWTNLEQRRELKAADDRPTPNVTVAKDGSGNFKTISEALAKIPETYQGRYDSDSSLSHSCILTNDITIQLSIYERSQPPRLFHILGKEYVLHYIIAGMWFMLKKEYTRRK